MADQDIPLVAHLMRRAGFGASRDEIEAKAAQGYDNVVHDLLNPTGGIDDDILMRYNPSYYEPGAIEVNTQLWVYKMINNPNQLQEKVGLFWHMIFCAGHSKIDSGQEMGIMVNMFREHGMGRFDDLLLRLSENPGMMYYLDNTESHKANLNENYGRELLELFSLGVGKDGAFNYSEDDVKVCARAFTGWNVAPSYPPFPHGRSPWVFRFDPADHDESEKTFLGETGPWNGDDIIRIICEQPGTARFLARHLYNYFVADEPQIPAWRLTPPRDVEAIRDPRRRPTSTPTTPSRPCSRPCSPPTSSRTSRSATRRSRTRPRWSSACFAWSASTRKSSPACSSCPRSPSTWART